MADMLASGVAWMANQLVTHAGQSVTYIRGGQSAVVAMRRSPQKENIVDVGGRDHAWQPVCFLVPTANLKLNNVRIRPQRGDKITCTVNSKTTVYEVHHPNAKAEPWVDMADAMTRIYTLQVVE
jgi:hypothetical protein